MTTPTTTAGPTRFRGESSRSAGSSTPKPDTAVRVLHIITALGTGGAERQLESLVRYTAATAQTIALYDGGVVADAMRADGRRVDVLGMGGGALGKLRSFARLVRDIRTVRPDVVHVHLLAAQLWGIPAARLAGVKQVISSEHSLMDTTIENRPLTPTLRRVYRVLERLSSHTIAVSSTTRDRLLRWNVAADRITVVDNGIDFAGLAYSAVARAAVRTELGIPADAVVIGGVGRLEPVKRFPQLLAALADRIARTPDLHLVVAGDGPLRDELVAAAHRWGIADRVHILGPRADIAALLSSFDVLVSPSRDETFGMAVIEGAGAGLPVVYAQCPALDELAELPSIAFPLARYGLDLRAADADAQEPTAIDAALDAALAIQVGDRSAPGALTDRYGIETAAEAIDRIYSGSAR